VSCERTLQAWTPPSPEQSALCQDFLRHLGAAGAGWSRLCPGAHLTASSLVCSPDHRVLLTLHAKLGRWLQTGGHIEADDATIEAAAMREAREETGMAEGVLDTRPLLLSRHPVPCWSGASTDHLDVQYLVTVPLAFTPAVSVESVRLRWFPFTALPDVDESVIALVAEAERRIAS
jgi:8-oxo-dGTP pyrophosphatase MutT (NUDIX family)